MHYYVEQHVDVFAVKLGRLYTCVVSNVHIVIIAEAFIMINDKQNLVLSSYTFNNLFFYNNKNFTYKI